MIISQIVAVAQNGVIGKDNDLIWKLPNDLKNFKKITSGHCLITGRKNYDSIGRPLPNRTNIIITRNKSFKAEGCIVVFSLDEALEVARSHKETEVFIMGGGQIYKESIDYCDKVYFTDVKSTFDGDTFYDRSMLNDFDEVERVQYTKDEKHLYDFDFVVFNRK